MDLLRNSHSGVLPLSPPASLFLFVASLTSLIANVSMAQVTITGVADLDQPPQNPLLSACLDNFCAPAAAANVLDYWDNVVANDNAVGVTGSLSVSQLAEYLSWHMATNSEYDPSCNFSMGTVVWGRTQARTALTSGTVATDKGPGIFDFALWDDDLHPMDNPGGPIKPFFPIGKKSRRWRVETKLATDYGSDAAIWTEIQAEINAGRPPVLSFKHWHLDHVSTVSNIEYFDWKVDVTGTSDMNFTTTGFTNMETPPTEDWNSDNRGHAVTGIGYRGAYDAGSGVKDWVIVHDNWPSTGKQVAVPFVLQTTGNPTAVTSVTLIDPVTEQEPEIVVDSSGTRHLVWWDGVDQIYYKNGATTGTVGPGTMIKTGQDPAIAIDPNNGHLWIAFRKPGPFVNDNIYVTNSSNGTTWSADTLVSKTLTCGACQEPSIAVDSGGNVQVAWEDDCDDVNAVCGDDWEIYANSRAGGTWGTPVQVTADVGAPDDRNPDLTADGSNVFLVHERGNDTVSFYKASLNLGSATYPTRETVDQAASNPIRGPKVAADSAGDAHVVWADRRSGDWETYYQARHSGAWRSSDQLVHNTTGPATSPDVALTSTSPGTDIHVGWEEENPLGTFDVQYKMITNNGSGVVNTTGSATNESGSDLASLEPAVYFGGSGNGAVQLVWTESLHLVAGTLPLGGYFTPVIPPLLLALDPVLESEPFDVVGYAQPFGTSDGPTPGVEVQVFVDGLPPGPPVFPQTTGPEAGRFTVNGVIASAGTHGITAHALDLQTGYLSEISPPTPISVPEPAGWMGLMACTAMLCVLARRRNTGRS